MKGLFRLPFAPLTLILSLVLLGGSMTPTMAKPAKERDIADTIAANPIMTHFAAMLQASPDLITLLSSRGPFTVFVPTDSAFSAIPQGTFDALLQPQNKERLEHIILFHVVNGKRLYAHDLLTVANLLSCEGSPLPIKKSHSGTQYVVKAKFIHADIRCQNGVIHEIDSLLVPSGPSLPPLIPTAVAPAPPAAGTAPASTNAPPVTDPPPATTSPAATTNAPPTAG